MLVLSNKTDRQTDLLLKDLFVAREMRCLGLVHDGGLGWTMLSQNAESLDDVVPQRRSGTVLGSISLVGPSLVLTCHSRARPL